MWAEDRGPPTSGPCLVPACPLLAGPSMCHQSFSTMNPVAPGKPSTRSSGYHQKALAEIRNSLLPFANSGGESTVGSSAASTISTLSTTSGVSSASGLSGFSTASGGNGLDKDLRQALSAMGHTEDALRAQKLIVGDLLPEPHNGLSKGLPSANTPGGLPSLAPKLMRKPSLERDLLRASPALDSGAASSRSDSPRLIELGGRQYSPPPPPPPRSGSTPPPPPPPLLLKRMSPVCGGAPARGASPVATPSTRQPMILQNGPQVQQHLTQQMQALSLLQSSGSGASVAQGSGVSTTSAAEPPPPYPPPSYTVSVQSRQSPTQDYRKSPSSGVYSGTTSAGTPSPVPTPPVTRPTPLLAWGARQAKTQPPIIMQSVKSTQVQKPVLQTAIAPTAPCPAASAAAAAVAAAAAAPPPQPPPPSYATSMQQKKVPTTEPPSYVSTMQVLASQRGKVLVAPPPPYSSEESFVSTVESGAAPRASPAIQPPSYHPALSSTTTTASSAGAVSAHKQNGERRTTPPNKVNHQSPIPERKKMTKEKEEERRDCKVRNYSPQAFKFYMEQHIENVFKSHKSRLFRSRQLENEMAKVDLSRDTQYQMRKMLSKRESNYIRLRRAKMDRAMFTKIKVIGVGAFGEVTLVRKVDTRHLYAMKTLRKADVLKRNQVAHVKAERDILAEADNEWVVKLFYSFQDKDNLYFVMDYVAGGDLMSLLIKMGTFEEPLARFYIAELTCAVESVHKMGFIHRDIKPDNILIDSNGHLKLTDFGLCTGFRWTHNSKYYQMNGEHARQDSMDPTEDWAAGKECRCSLLKPLERRRRREHQRCLAHSLVGTPNYIAPEVLSRMGYTQLCDWWSVGVIMYEMLVGSPPFYASTPEETQYKVINWEKTLQIPKAANLSPEATDLILKFCTSADRRIGKNASEVKEHPFFASVNFEKGLRTQVAPHIPRISYLTDTSNFDPVDPERLHNSDSSGDSDEHLDNDNPFHGFFEFTFRRFFDDGGWPYPAKEAVDDNDNQGPVYV